MPYADHPSSTRCSPGRSWASPPAGEATRGHAGPAAGGLSEIVQAYFTVTALLLSICMLVVTWSTVPAGRAAAWDAAMVALSPLVIVHAFTNWDLFAVALAGVGLVAWQGRRPGLAGVLLGLGTAAKLYPALFFIPLLVLCWRAGQLPAFWRAAARRGGRPGRWSTCRSRLLYPESWRRSSSSTGSGRPTSTRSGTAWTTCSPAAATPARRRRSTARPRSSSCSRWSRCSLLGLAAPRRPRLPQLLFLAVAGFLLPTRCGARSTRSGCCRWPCWPARPGGRCWPGRSPSAWSGCPRLLWFLGTGGEGRRLRVVPRRGAAARPGRCWCWSRWSSGTCCGPERDVVRAPDRPVARRDDPAGGVLDWRRRTAGRWCCPVSSGSRTTTGSRTLRVDGDETAGTPRRAGRAAPPCPRRRAPPPAWPRRSRRPG